MGDTNNLVLNTVDLVESRIERLEKLVGNFEKHDESQVLILRF